MLFVWVGAVLMTTGVVAATLGGDRLPGVCAGCHGEEGVSAGSATPTIAGTKTETFVQRMRDFKTGNRTATLMDRIANGYTDDEIGRMGEYFSKRPFERAQQPTDRAMAERGKHFAEQYCASCHEEAGTVDDGRPGILAGQWLSYLRFRLEDYRLGVDRIPKKMRLGIESILHEAGVEGLESVLQFYASQK